MMTMTPAQALDAAIAFRDQPQGRPTGAATAKARADIAARVADAKPSAVINPEAMRLTGLTVADMPADPDDVSLLLDVIAFRRGLTTRADCWRRIGINPERGRALLTRNRKALDWPIWRALVAEALE